ncbi:MAG: AraC family transcriptional regulator [Flavobacteriaceae bacterium]|nr:AraC family transcriptional regulator [Flavobacteriaceae bacterium]
MSKIFHYLQLKNPNKINNTSITLTYNLKHYLVFILLFTITTNAQDLDQFYLNKLYEHTEKNKDSMLYYANKLKNSKNLCNRYKAINYKSKAFYQIGKIEESELLSKSVLEDLKDKNEKCLKHEKLAALNRLFWIYKNKRLYQYAFQIVLERESVIETLPKNALYYAQMRSVNQNLAIIKSIMGLHVEARQILKNNLSLLPEQYEDLKEESYHRNEEEANYFLKLNQSSLLNLIGESYLNSSTSYNSKLLDSASHYFKKAYSIAQKFNPPHKDSETIYQLRESEVLIAKKKYNESLKLIKKFSKNSEEFGTTQRINALKAICYNNLGVNDSAVFYARKFLKKYQNEKNYKEKLIAIYDILSNQYFKRKKLDSAYKYSELTIKELNEFNKNKSLVNKAHYLHNDNDIKVLNRSILRKENNKQIIIIVFAIIVIIILIWLYYSLKSKKSKIEEELEVTKTQISPKIKKKDYNIHKDVEENILKGIREFEKSKGYLDPEFNINSLAKSLDTNTTYLSFIFNKNYNQSFKNYITNLRIEYLVKQLKENKTLRNYTIKALAEEIGYSNASAFSRAFKKLKGITPSDYLKALS